MDVPIYSPFDDEFSARMKLHPIVRSERQILTVRGTLDVATNQGPIRVEIVVPVPVIAALLRIMRPQNYAIKTGGLWSDIVEADPTGVLGKAEESAEAIGQGASDVVSMAKDAWGDTGAKDVAPFISPANAFIYKTVTDVSKGRNPLDSMRESAQWAWDNRAKSLRYGAIIASFVPGVGSGVASALAAGAALSEGRSIDEAMIEGALAALPGGALARMAAETARNLYRGENLTQSALMGVRAGLPPGHRAAFDVGLALAHGQSVQNAAISAAKTVMPGGREGRAALDFAERIARGDSVRDAAIAAGGPLALAAIESVVLGTTTGEQLAALATARNALVQSLALTALREGGQYGKQVAAAANTIARTAQVMARAKGNPFARAQLSRMAESPHARSMLQSADALLKGDWVKLIRASTPYGPTQWDKYRAWVQSATGIKGYSVGLPDSEFATSGEYIMPPDLSDSP